MYLAYKYANRKYKERKEAKAAEAGKAPSPESEPGVQQDVAESHQIATTARLEDNGVETVEEKTKLPSSGKQEKPKEDPAVKKRRIQYRMKIIFGLVAPFTLQALDTTIIASALPFIAKDFSRHLWTSTFCRSY